FTRKAGTPSTEGVKWVSDGSGEYSLETVDRESRGTEITLKLRKDAKEFLDRYRIRSTIAKYSDHISLPIQMLKEPERDDDGKVIKGQQPEWETINKGSALWARPKNEITAEEHAAFYQSLTYDPEPPASILHNRVEGKLEYISLLYIPSKAPFDLWDREQRHGIKLYVRRIFIADDAKQLMPNYLRFVRGLVDSSDLPLNVSREFLQQNAQIDKIRAASVKKVLGELKKIATKDTEKYNTLWKEYGKVLKEGVVEDHDNQEAIAKLLRFATTHGDSDEQTVALDDYVSRMNEKQEKIYFVTAESHAAAASSPHLEVFRKNDIEVLLLSDPVDEWLVSSLMNFDGKQLQSIAKGDLDIEDLKSDEDKEDSEKKSEALGPLVEKIKSLLENQVKDVKISTRLVDSPACLVADQFDMGGNMERILQAMGQDAPQAKPILEINPDHAIVARLNPEADNLEDWARVLFDQAALAEGASLKDPAAYVARVNKLLAG
ncbi:MAG: molecular chaperone HtpG, partial [Pseudomonadota bacterium]